MKTLLFQSITLAFLNLFSVLSCASINLPINLNNHCLINVVVSKLFKNPLLPVDSNWTHTYTFHNVSRLLLSLPQTHIENHLDLKNGYLRFSSKKQSTYCIVFLLLKNTFSETVSAIQRSGYGTSDKAFFFVKLEPQYGLEILRGFSILVFHRNLAAFHTNLVFFDGADQWVTVYCYFCPMQKFITFSKMLKLEQILKYSASVNSKGYGRFAHVELPYFPTGAVIVDDIPVCFRSTRARPGSLESLIEILKKCPYTELIYLSPVQSVLNFTIAPSLANFPLDEWKTASWFLRIVAGESIFQEIPNRIVETRGFVYISHLDFAQYVIACVETDSMSYFDYNEITVINTSVWMTLFAVVLVYGYVCKDLLKGLDILWPLIGRQSSLKHMGAPFGVITMAMLVLSASHQSYVSSDLLVLNEFPSFSELLAKEYRIAIPSLCQIIMPLLEIFVSQDSKQVIKEYFGGRGLLEVFVANVNSNAVEKDGLTKVLKEGTKNKLVYSTFAHPAFTGMYEIMNGGLWNVQDEFMCKRFDSKINQPLMLKLSVRYWGYLSNRFYELYSRWEEMGFLKKINRLKVATRLKFVRDHAKMEDLGSMKEVTDLTLCSALGVTGAALFTLGTFISITHVLVYGFQRVLILLKVLTRRTNCLQRKWISMHSFVTHICRCVVRHNHRS